MERILKEITMNVSEQAKFKLINVYLMPLFGLHSTEGLPKIGRKFNKITIFPNGKSVI